MESYMTDVHIPGSLAYDRAFNLARIPTGPHANAGVHPHRSSC